MVQLIEFVLKSFI